MKYAIVLASVLVLAQTTLGQAVQWRVDDDGTAGPSDLAIVLNEQ